MCPVKHSGIKEDIHKPTHHFADILLEIHQKRSEMTTILDGLAHSKQEDLESFLKEVNETIDKLAPEHHASTHDWWHIWRPWLIIKLITILLSRMKGTYYYDTLLAVRSELESRTHNQLTVKGLGKAKDEHIKAFRAKHPEFADASEFDILYELVSRDDELTDEADKKLYYKILYIEHIVDEPFGRVRHYSNPKDCPKFNAYYRKLMQATKLYYEVEAELNLNKLASGKINVTIQTLQYRVIEAHARLWFDYFKTTFYANETQCIRHYKTLLALVAKGYEPFDITMAKHRTGDSRISFDVDYKDDKMKIDALPFRETCKKHEVCFAADEPIRLFNNHLESAAKIFQIYVKEYLDFKLLYPGDDKTLKRIMDKPTKKAGEDRAWADEAIRELHYKLQREYKSLKRDATSRPEFILDVEKACSYLKKGYWRVCDNPDSKKPQLLYLNTQSSYRNISKEELLQIAERLKAAAGRPVLMSEAASSKDFVAANRADLDAIATTACEVPLSGIRDNQLAIIPDFDSKDEKVSVQRYWLVRQLKSIYKDFDIELDTAGDVVDRIIELSKPSAAFALYELALKLNVMPRSDFSSEDEDDEDEGEGDSPPSEQTVDENAQPSLVKH